MTKTTINPFSDIGAALGIRLVDGKLRPGEVGFANEAAFDATFLSQPLTQFVVGNGGTKREEKLRETLEFLAPAVRVPRKFEFRVSNDKADFAAEEADGDIRAMYGEYKRIQAHGTTADAHTVAKGFSTVIEKDEEKEVPHLREDKARWLKCVLLRAEILRAFGLLNAAATNTAKTWGSGTPQPDSDVTAMLEAAGDDKGLDPNRVLFGRTAWQKRVQAYAGQNTAGAFAGYNRTPAALADWLDVDGVLVSKERYQSGSGKAKLTTANVVLAFAAEDGMTGDDPSNIKRFVSPTAGGDWAVYTRDLTSELVEITVAHRSKIVLTSSLGIRKLTIS